MNKAITPPGAPDPWQTLRRFTQARIALGRSGNSLPTSALLDFSLAHAQARDAVHLPLDTTALAQALAAGGFSSLAVRSQAGERSTYLRRPDLGRRLDVESQTRLQAAAGALPAAPDLVFVIADGLSALAVERHALALLEAVVLWLAGWSIGPVVIAGQARVALGDPIALALRARAVVVLIGERPGLSSPDSLGVYLTHGPQPGFSDANRNCISNVRPGGLGYGDAARKLAYLLAGARRLGFSGVGLKDDSDALIATDARPAISAEPPTPFVSSLSTPTGDPQCNAVNSSSL